MIDVVLRKIFGTKHERDVKRITPTVVASNAFEPSVRALGDAELQAKTDEFRKRLEAGEPLDELLPESFAVCREAARRTVGMRHFDVQLIGGVVLHEGKIAGMATGEGKTLVATLPAYLSDNMRFTLDELVQRELHYAIVDEVDSILIDEARTPLIISGPADESTELYYKLDRIIPKLKRAATIVEGKLSEIEAQKEGDYIVDEKARAVALTEQGIATCERLLSVDNLYDPQHITLLHHIQQGLRAHALFKRDVDYVVKDGQVIIVDEFTGRLMPGRRWSDGLHQAVEAKEGVRIERENQTLATITFQNYFRM